MGIPANATRQRRKITPQNEFRNTRLRHLRDVQEDHGGYAISESCASEGLHSGRAIPGTTRGLASRVAYRPGCEVCAFRLVV